MRPMLRPLLLVSLVATLFCGPPAAVAEPRPIVEMNHLRFAVDGDGDWLLTVAGPDGHYQRRVFRGADPTISLYRDDKGALADGVYVWELRPLDRELQDRAAVRSGHFGMRSGVAVLPDESVSDERTTSPAPTSAVERAAGAGLGDPIPPSVDHAGDFYIGQDFVSGGGVGKLAFGGAIDGTESLALTSMLVEGDNIRLKFTDVSSMLSFPTNDWQMTMNDSSNGGAEYFRIEDLDASTRPLRIDAGAATDSLRIDQNGNVGIGTATPATLLQVAGDATIDGNLSVLSSRHLKEGFAAVDGAEVLARLAALPLVEWSYLGRADRHLGPVAEDFHAAFALGRDARSINPLDLGGVALAAIQGLAARLEALERQHAATAELAESRRRQIDRLLDERVALARRLEALEAHLGTEAQIQPPPVEP